MRVQARTSGPLSRPIALLLCGASALATAPHAVAADSAPATSARAELDEIVVTAQRREERLQDVPISVTAFDRATMDVQGTRSIDDIARLTPGVSFTRSANNNNSESANIAIRGITSNAGASTTGVYIDDTPIQGRNLSFPSFNTYPTLFDLERVEILRGPQGTLFGAGSEGGTIRFISPEPSLDRSALYARSEFATTTGGDASYEVGVAGGTPLVDGRVAVRTSASYRRDGGWVDRVDRHSGSVDEAVNSAATKTARLALKWQATDALSITPSVFYQQREVDDTSAWWELRAGEPDPTNGQFASRYRTGNSVASPNRDKFVLPALKVLWDLGSLRLVSSTSYFRRDQSATTDYTQFDRAIFLGSPFGLPGEAGAGFWGDRQRNFTQEIRLESADVAARLAWTAGVFYQHAKETTRHQVYDPSLLVTFGLPADFGGGYIYVENPRTGLDTQGAVFGQADFKATERLTLTAGARWAHAKFEGTAVYPETLVVGPAVTSSGNLTEKPFTPKLGFDYRLADGHLLYGTAAKGFRIGGANARLGQFCYGPGGSLDQIGLQNEPATYDSDSLWSYELGSKNAFADGGVVLNASVYYVKWKNIQQNVGLGCGFQFTSNLGEAESKGFDLQANIRAGEHVTLGGTFGYTRAEFTKTVQLQPSVASIVRQGDRLAGSPWNVALYGQIDFPLFGRSGYVRADHQYGAKQDSVVPAQNPLNGGYALWFEGVPSQGFTSLRAGLTWERLDVSLFAQNLFDSRPKLTATQDIAGPTGGTPLFYVISYRPRTVGLTATYRY